MIPNEIVRQANGYDVDAASVAAGLRCEDESLAVQSQKDEADINVLVRRFGVTGVLPVRELPAALQGHVEEFDLMTAHQVLIDARESFLSLPADARGRFGNDPVKFYEFAIDEKNVDEMRKMGLAKAKVEPVPEVVQKVEIVEKDHGEERRRDAGAARGARGTRKADWSES